MGTGRRYQDGDSLHATAFNELLDTVEDNTIAIEETRNSIPKKTSQLTNDAGFITGATTTEIIQVSDGAPIDATGIWENNEIPEGTSIQNILEKLLLREILPSAAQKPSITLSGGTNLGLFVIGSTVTIPAITMSKKPGKFDKDNKVPANSGRTPSITWSAESITVSVSKFNNVTINSGTTGTTSASTTVELGENKITYSGSADYTKPTNHPVTNLGNETDSTTQVETGGTDISAIWAASSTTTSTTVTAVGVYPCYTNISGNTLVASASVAVDLNVLSSDYKEITLVDVPSENVAGKHFAFEYPSGRTCTFQIKDLSNNFVDYAGSYTQSGTPEHSGYIRLETTGDSLQGVNTYKLILSKGLNS